MAIQIHHYPLFFLLFVSLIRCRAQNTSNTSSACIPSSCGNLHNITFPFRLKSDPENCGNRNFELDCQNNHTFVTFKSKRFHVLSIDYSNFTLRVVDPALDNDNNCSFPTYTSVGYDDFPSLIYDILEYNLDIVYLNCLKPITSSSSRFVDNSFCGNTNRSGSAFFNSSRVFSYVGVADGLKLWELEESCTVCKMTMASINGPTQARNSLSGIHSMLAYGFEVSWFRVLCHDCEASNGGFCSLQDNAVTCKHYCSEDIPLSQLGFKCQFQFYGGLTLAFGSIALGGLIGLRFLCGISCLIGLLVHKWRRRHLSADESIEQFLQDQTDLSPIKYRYSQIKKMTDNFREKLGEGCYGTVYKGKLRSGPYVAVKIMESTTASEQDFVSEVATIGRIHHVNVVRLIGFCTEDSNRALIYEYMPNGSLDKYIVPRGGSVSLSYEKMFEISLGVARGIDYLHRGCDMRILHFDIKPHNILLDENFNPKISDFGLAKLYPIDESFVSLPAARGTMGYMAPEMFYKNIGAVSYKADVYSFGMLLMEMASRTENKNPGAENVSQIYFPCWAYDQFQAGRDIDYIGNISAAERKLVKKMIIVALWCIQMKPADRPPMNKIVEMLEGEADLVRMPPKPFIAPREMADEHGVTALKGSSVVLSIDPR